MDPKYLYVKLQIVVFTSADQSTELPFNSVHQLFFCAVVQDGGRGGGGAVAAARCPAGSGLNGD